MLFIKMTRLLFGHTHFCFPISCSSRRTLWWTTRCCRTTTRKMMITSHAPGADEDVLQPSPTSTLHHFLLSFHFFVKWLFLIMRQFAMSMPFLFYVLAVTLSWRLTRLCSDFLFHSVKKCRITCLSNLVYYGKPRLMCKNPDTVTNF